MLASTVKACEVFLNSFRRTATISASSIWTEKDWSTVQQKEESSWLGLPFET